MKFIPSIVLLLLTFFSGYSIDAIINSNSNDRIITLDASCKGETGLYESKVDISIDKKLDVILTELNSISLNMNSKELSCETTNECNSALNTSVTKKNTYMSVEDAVDAKNQIYNSLLESNYTFNQLVASDQLNELSPANKQEVLDEVARRIDSGEINKEDFLPGYESSSN